ncbi:hypothetical protein CR513_06797, partial [Mucuna pruriens]
MDHRRASLMRSSSGHHGGKHIFRSQFVARCQDRGDFFEKRGDSRELLVAITCLSLGMQTKKGLISTRSQINLVLAQSHADFDSAWSWIKLDSAQSHIGCQEDDKLYSSIIWVDMPLDIIPKSATTVEVTSPPYGTILTISKARKPHAQENYDWVSEEIRAYKSLIFSYMIVDAFTKSVVWIGEEATNDFTLERCSAEKRVYHSTKEGEEDFVYLYETMVRDLGVILPFDKYEADVLQILGVASTQLHPNGWATMQAFKVICHCLHIKHTTSLFLCHYTTRIGVKPSWVSLSLLPKTNLFNAYSTSYIKTSL